jgi:hypothetical protein
MALSDEDNRAYAERRSATADQLVRALLVINGGGAIALLGFLQAIWSKEPALAESVVWGIAWLSVGLSLGACANFFRYKTSQAHQEEWPSKKKWTRISWIVQGCSLLAFDVGVAVVLYGALDLLR